MTGQWRDNKQPKGFHMCLFRSFPLPPLQDKDFVWQLSWRLWHVKASDQTPDTHWCSTAITEICPKNHRGRFLRRFIYVGRLTRSLSKKPRTVSRTSASRRTVAPQLPFCCGLTLRSRAWVFLPLPPPLAPLEQNKSMGTQRHVTHKRTYPHKHAYMYPHTRYRAGIWLQRGFQTLIVT